MSTSPTVRYVQINGRSYPIKLSQAAIMRTLEEEGLTVREMAAVQDYKTWPIGRQCRIVYHGIAIACRQTGQPFDLTYDDIRDAYYDDDRFVGDVAKVMNASQPLDPKEDDKKKATPGSTKSR